MNALDEAIREYSKQLQKGQIQKARKGTMTFIVALKTTLESGNPDHVASHQSAGRKSQKHQQVRFHLSISCRRGYYVSLEVPLFRFVAKTCCRKPSPFLSFLLGCGLLKCLRTQSKT